MNIREGHFRKQRQPLPFPLGWTASSLLPLNHSGQKLVLSQVPLHLA